MTGNQASPKINTVRDLRSVLLTDLNTIRQVPKVRSGTPCTFEDTKRLFGDDLKEKVKLRLPGRHAGSVQLPQIRPNVWALPEYGNYWVIRCRQPSCNDKIHYCFPRDGDVTFDKPLSFYLCQSHLIELKSKIARKIEAISEPFSLSMEDHEQKDLAECTSLIGLLEAVFHDSKTTKSPVILEAILNVRNFLIITSTVFKQNDVPAVPLVALILRLILQNEHPDDLLSVLREVIGSMLHAYGINYPWIWKTTAPIGRIFFVGGCIAAAVATAAFMDVLPSREWLAMLLAGIFIYYFPDKKKDRKDMYRWQKIISKGYMYNFHGDANGTFDLSVCTYN